MSCLTCAPLLPYAVISEAEQALREKIEVPDELPNPADVKHASLNKLDAALAGNSSPRSYLPPVSEMHGHDDSDDEDDHSTSVVPPAATGVTLSSVGSSHNVFASDGWRKTALSSAQPDEDLFGSAAGSRRLSFGSPQIVNAPSLDGASDRNPVEMSPMTDSSDLVSAPAITSPPAVSKPVTAAAAPISSGGPSAFSAESSFQLLSEMGRQLSENARLSRKQAQQKQDAEPASSGSQRKIAYKAPIDSPSPPLLADYESV